MYDLYIGAKDKLGYTIDWKLTLQAMSFETINKMMTELNELKVPYRVEFLGE